MEGESDVLTWLEHWYRTQSDGDREHQHGLEITTIDNPGWAVSIDLHLTRYAKIADREVRSDTHESDDDWWICEIKDQKFQRNGDPTKLRVILETFRTWIEHA
jgi:hypothetical protein